MVLCARPTEGRPAGNLLRQGPSVLPFAALATVGAAPTTTLPSLPLTTVRAISPSVAPVAALRTARTTVAAAPAAVALAASTGCHVCTRR